MQLDRTAVVAAHGHAMHRQPLVQRSPDRPNLQPSAHHLRLDSRYIAACRPEVRHHGRPVRHPIPRRGLHPAPGLAQTSQHPPRLWLVDQAKRDRRAVGGQLRGGPHVPRRPAAQSRDAVQAQRHLDATVSAQLGQDLRRLSMHALAAVDDECPQVAYTRDGRSGGRLGIHVPDDRCNRRTQIAHLFVDRLFGRRLARVAHQQLGHGVHAHERATPQRGTRGRCRGWPTPGRLRARAHDLHPRRARAHVQLADQALDLVGAIDRGDDDQRVGAHVGGERESRASAAAHRERLLKDASQVRRVRVLQPVDTDLRRTGQGVTGHDRWQARRPPRPGPDHRQPQHP